ncbi:TPA: AAA family ATPase [Escherichia coli]|nr:AAA family ATPase [Escherichia coli]EKG1480386.1 AAA family ATPase [Escherichia coli]ELC3357280.1 AAA family ATPase [Escherichia coli]HCL9831517.1 AAA family ATPase [Escherichia coli]HCL9850808.1 AAA family ATPase [Escherichia coli]
MFKFMVTDRNEFAPSSGVNSGYLRADNWNDYSFVTMFHLTIFDESGGRHEIGNVKIGFKGQKEDVSTSSTLQKTFTFLSENYFSIGDGLEYYKNISKLSEKLKKEILTALNDIVQQPEILNEIESENVLNTSLFRGVTLSEVHGQFNRVLNGLSELSDFYFSFNRVGVNGYSDLKLPFDVEVDSMPSTNIHACIGRNGCGKTTILNDMIEAIIDPDNKGCFFTERQTFSESRIPKGYFRSLVSVSFSAFDPFSPPQEQPDPAKGTQYFYIGLKNSENQKLKSLDDLRLEFVTALIGCLRTEKKKELWIKAIEKLSSDKNFADMELSALVFRYEALKNKKSEIQVDNKSFRDMFYTNIKKYLSRMSSGHAIVLFTITRLVDTVGEKSLVLLDEPEVHLHPPLLSAFLRALSDLLDAKNGVAIIATHSPVVLQEIPKSCVWKVLRSREALRVTRPDIETFGENLGVLTREVFSLEVTSSGYHDLLRDSVASGKSYKKILKKYNNQIGLEGRAVLKAMVLSRDSGNE